jgi:hypothetical protein
MHTNQALVSRYSDTLIMVYIEKLRREAGAATWPSA